MYAQVIQGGAAPQQRAQMDAIVHEQMIPALNDEPGFTGALNLVDRDSGNAMMVVIWQEEEQGAPAAPRVRTQVPPGPRVDRRHLERQPRADLDLGRERARLTATPAAAAGGLAVPPVAGSPHCPGRVTAGGCGCQQGEPR